MVHPDTRYCGISNAAVGYANFLAGRSAPRFVYSILAGRRFASNLGPAPKNFQKRKYAIKLAEARAWITEERSRQQVLISINELMEGASTDDQVIDITLQP